MKLFTNNLFTIYFRFQILNGIQHCHSIKLMHRDLKPANLLVGDNGVIKIADFGMSHVLSSATNY